jgi:putative endopeptidase
MRSGIDLQHIDPAIRPQDDLFGHLNGRWFEEAQIPDDRPADGVFYALRDAAEADVRQIIENAAADGEPGSVASKVGDLYASFMDEQTVEALGRTPLAGDLAAIAATSNITGFLELMARLERGGVGGVFAAFINTDAGNSERYLVHLEQSGLGLPDESYYREDSFAEIREQYRAHVGRMLVLCGAVAPADADSAADAVLAVETDLASRHWSAVECRDAVKTYNLMPIADLDGLVGPLDVPQWFATLGAPAGAVAEVVVRQPSFAESLPDVLASHSLAEWQHWLSWALVRSSAALLDSEVVDANFSFYGTVLSGVPQLRERWKRGVSLVEGALGEAVGELYVAEHFPPSAKAEMEALVANLVAAYRESISALEWMGPQTRERALAKLAAFTPKIGYPDKWRDYTGLEISREDLVGNVRRSSAHEADREWAKLGGPVDRGEWFMTPQTVNAYYNPGMNEIVFPAAILQPPFFDPDVDDAANYGAIGAVIGHEIGHGFDDQGSRYDGAGNLTDWWTEEDRERFDALAQRLVAQFNALSPRGLDASHKVNGALTVGENIGDVGGVAVALEAYQISLAGQEAPVIDGLTGVQRFFLGWAQTWRAKVREAEEIRRLATDPHSPADLRCNVVANLDGFHEAFATAPGDGMWLEPPERVRIW